MSQREPAGSTSFWEPKPTYSAADVIEMDRQTRGLPDIEIVEREDVFRIRTLGLDWDIGVYVTEPADQSRAARGPDGKKIGFLLLHGGDGDFKSCSTLARLIAGKFGSRAVSMTFPGRLYLNDPARDWPSDTIRADGSVRTPIWLAGETIERDEYDVIIDETPMNRLRYGRRTLARAKPGTTFWHRMAAWPAAFEDGMIEACRRHFPEDEFSIFTHGHSTGGAFSAYIVQRVPNIAGQTEIETAPLGYINEVKHDWSGALGKICDYDRVKIEAARRTDPFNELYIRTWRDLARYFGPEALGKEGPTALMRLPWLMEEVLDAWGKDRARPSFKAEYTITHNIVASLDAAARAVAERMGMDDAQTHALAQRFRGYCHYDTRPGAKPVTPILYVNSGYSRDNSPEAFSEIILPMLAQLNPAPRVRVTQLQAGTHIYYRPEPDLPLGLAPTAAKLWHDAIHGGFFHTGR
jgi:hypothetical protein